MQTSSHPIWCWALGPTYIKARARKAWVPSSVFAPAAAVVDYYHCRNVAFFPGDERYTAEHFEAVAQYDQVLAQVYHLTETGKERAKDVSQLSQHQPNLIGGIVDDFSTAISRGEGLPEDIRLLAENLKSENAALDLHAVCYTMHFDVDLCPFLPYIDYISLWVWDPADLVDLDTHIAEATRRYHKPMHLGLYLFDYGVTGEAMPIETLVFQCERARQYYHDGRIQGIHILGSYTNDEFNTEQAKWLADYCQSF